MHPGITPVTYGYELMSVKLRDHDKYLLLSNSDDEVVLTDDALRRWI